MTRTSLLLLFALLASIGINVGFALHIGKDWHENRMHTNRIASLPGRMGFRDLVDGTCGVEELSLNQERLDNHINQISGSVNLDEEQIEKLGQLILNRAEVSCTLREKRANLNRKPVEQSLNSFETSRAFLNNMLSFRETLIQATLAETRAQRAFLNSLDDKQISAIDAHILPHLIPGLSVREFVGDRRSKGQHR